MPRITILLLGIPSITEIIELEEVMDSTSFPAVWSETIIYQKYCF